MKKNWKIEFKWLKAYARIFGNEFVDRLAKETTQKGYPERQHKGMAKTMGGSNERCDYKRFLSKCRKKTGSESTLKPMFNNNYDQLRKN